MTSLPLHNLRVVLFQPQIAPNTGNIGRLCVAANAELHLVRPLGFVLSDRELRRSAMDYWPRLKLRVHDDDGAFFEWVGSGRCWFFSTKASRSFWEASFEREDYLVFGSERRGLPESLLARNVERSLRIPQWEGERCLNLSTAAGVALYEAMRQMG